jgi:hypothetical protein
MSSENQQIDITVLLLQHKELKIKHPIALLKSQESEYLSTQVPEINVAPPKASDVSSAPLPDCLHHQSTSVATVAPPLSSRERKHAKTRKLRKETADKVSVYV